MHDSGSRDTFNTGCVRDNGETKPRPDLISPFAKLRLGDWLRKGLEKYDERNWEKGMPISRCLEAIDRHYCKYQMGRTDEDHMAAVMCNAMFIMHYEEMIKIGSLPASLDNRPNYKPMPILVRGTLMLNVGEDLKAGDPVQYTTPMDGERIPFVKKLEASADRMANATRRVDEAQDALMKELDIATDTAYGLELDGQNDNPTGLNPILKDMSSYGQTHKPLSSMPEVSKVTGKAKKDFTVEKAMRLHKVRAFIFPDDNKVPLMVKQIQDASPVDNRQLDHCYICGTLDDIKYYRQDLKRSYCSNCYHNNRIDLKLFIGS